MTPLLTSDLVGTGTVLTYSYSSKFLEFHVQNTWDSRGVTVYGKEVEVWDAPGIRSCNSEDW